VSLDQLAALTVFTFVTSITPGPNNVMLAASGANVGIVRGLPHVFGITLGFSLMIFLVAAGLGSVILDNPTAMSVLRYVGIAVLLWLAWKIATAGKAKGAENARPIGFFAAIAFQWVNPKAWLICAGAVSGFLQEGAAAIPQAAIFALAFMTVGTPCMLVWLGFGAAMQYVLRTERALRAFNIFMGLLLAATIPLLLGE
jgi:threonine/homoserine/homoserine lactone efflux protein